ncbi:uncharacterized protein LY89DRAFT_727603 [Mollisia scopiformis]|uniref:Uncharacterized protein n=1 Tax=Mollisia scopiformis TaxID=149040 RepID=A0A194XXM5_MOLSC|nr:uncharacterized protein LY89DRAFT_727603 [Mollisia scopiformis]KUJ24582.1 hypothetical protein LY89DRAFT_727603 [Mollisia scopiformis]
MSSSTIRDKEELKSGTGAHFAAILRPLGSSSGSDTHLSLVKKECLASWSWKDDMNPTIYVPGSPAIWGSPNSRSPPQNIVTRSPPFYAVFKSLRVRQGLDFDFSSLSIVSNRNSMTKILHYALGYGRDTWRIDIDVLGETVMFSRWGLDNTKGLRDWSSGKEVEKGCTYLPHGVNTTSHHRLHHYSIGEVDFHMYHEADAYTGGPPATRTEDLVLTIEPAPSIFRPFDASLGVPSFQVVQNLAKQDVKVEVRGSIVKDAKVIEIIPQLDGASLDLAHRMPKQWLTNCKRCYVGIHNHHGQVEHVDIYPMPPLYESWEKLHQDELRIFVDTLKQIKQAVLHRTGKRPGSGGKFALIGHCFGDEGEKKQLWLYDRMGDGVRLPAGVEEKLKIAVLYSR